MRNDKSGSTTDERRAKVIILDQLSEDLFVDFPAKWQKFLKEKDRFDKPQIIASEFIERWGEL